MDGIRVGNLQQNKGLPFTITPSKSYCREDVSVIADIAYLVEESISSRRESCSWSSAHNTVSLVMRTVTEPSSDQALQLPVS